MKNKKEKLVEQGLNLTMVLMFSGLLVVASGTVIGVSAIWLSYLPTMGLPAAIVSFGLGLIMISIGIMLLTTLFDAMED